MFWSHPRASALRETGLFSELDLAFAGYMARLDQDKTREMGLILASALASRQGSVGDTCLDLDHPPEEARRPLNEAGVVLPGGSDWAETIGYSSVVGEPEHVRPLILDGHRLYLQRFHQDEVDVQAMLLTMVRDRPPPVDQAALKDGLDQIFPECRGEDGPNRQRLAAFAAARSRFCVVTGGPGTGKTTAVAGVLALLLMVHPERSLRMALAAPTGKAADRLRESVRRVKSSLNLDQDIAGQIPEEALTLHRLLGIDPITGQPRYGQSHPLPVDVLVVDEASMIDLPLMAKTLRALGPEARLILVGDRDQLSSVAPGTVLGDICGPPWGAERFSPDFILDWNLCGGLPLTEETTAGSPPLLDAVVGLNRPFRFSKKSGIRALSEAVRQGDRQAVLSILAQDEAGDLRWVEPSKLPDGRGCLRDVLRGEIENGYRPLGLSDGVAEAFLALGAFRILAPANQGPLGVDRLNEMCERVLDQADLMDVRGEWYQKRPVMVLANSYDTGLFNGDVGLARRVEGRTVVVFPGQGGEWREFSPGRLPETATTFAMTIHKSQGSEFDRVLLVLPDEDFGLLTRELVYTAITRAKSSLILVAKEDILLGAVTRRTRRDSGLRERLWTGL
ncbi:MAG: exodeoxyribonuclease V subunit alpha [Deltaproteobacteria bacterium]|nr:exodeoxyribonuclease V subunit alpha [Deltaproteobacteria bacterium]